MNKCSQSTLYKGFKEYFWKPIDIERKGTATIKKLPWISNSRVLDRFISGKILKSLSTNQEERTTLSAVCIYSTSFL